MNWIEVLKVAGIVILFLLAGGFAWLAFTLNHVRKNPSTSKDKHGFDWLR